MAIYLLSLLSLFVGIMIGQIWSDERGKKGERRGN